VRFRMIRQRGERELRLEGFLSKKESSRPPVPLDGRGGETGAGSSPTNREGEEGRPFFLGKGRKHLVLAPRGARAPYEKKVLVRIGKVHKTRKISVFEEEASAL